MIASASQSILRNSGGTGPGAEAGSGFCALRLSRSAFFGFIIANLINKQSILPNYPPACYPKFWARPTGVPMPLFAIELFLALPRKWG